MSEGPSPTPTSLPAKETAPGKKAEATTTSPTHNPNQSLVQVPSVGAAAPPLPPSTTPQAISTSLSGHEQKAPQGTLSSPDEQKPSVKTVPDVQPHAPVATVERNNSKPSNESSLPAEIPPQQTDIQPQPSTGGTKLSIFPSTNGSGKKKAVRGKVKLRLNLVAVLDGKVVKCSLVTSASQLVYFQFSMEYDKPQEIFQKFVSPV